MASWTHILRKQHDFRKLWLSGAISLVGDWVGLVAVSFAALDEGGKTMALALFYAAHMLPGAFLAPFAGVLADRLDRRRLLVVTNVIQAVLTVALALSVHTKHVGLGAFLLFLRGCVAAFVSPAESAALTVLLPSEYLLDANAILSATWSVTYALGMVCGGIVTSLGAFTALLLDAVTFVVAAVILAGIPPMKPEEQKPLGQALLGSIRDLRQALVALKNVRLLSAVLGKLPIALAGGAGWISMNLVTRSVVPFKTAAISLGILQAIRGVGTGVGPLLATRYEGQIQPAVMRTIALTMGFASIAVFTYSRSGLWLGLMAFLWGNGVGANWVLTTVDIQKTAPREMVGRMSALDNLSTTGGFVATVVLAAVLVDYGELHSYQWAGTVGVVIGVVVWGLLSLIMLRGKVVNRSGV